MKEITTWYSDRLQRDMPLVRWGHYGRPLLLFPTAGGDAEEVERCHLIQAIDPLIAAGKIKVYSVDSVAGRAWLSSGDVAHRVWMQKQFDAYIRDEVVPAIREDCRSPTIEPMTAGASIGAYNALVSICRHPDVFSTAICMSGTYNLEKWLEGQWYDDFYYLSPVHFLPGLNDGESLNRLRQRMVILATGEGRYEDPRESWRVAHALGEKGIPNRVDLWGEAWDHDWATWRAMLPQYLQVLTTD